MAFIFFDMHDFGAIDNALVSKFLCSLFCKIYFWNIMVMTLHCHTEPIFHLCLVFLFPVAHVKLDTLQIWEWRTPPHMQKFIWYDTVILYCHAELVFHLPCLFSPVPQVIIDLLQIWEWRAPHIQKCNFISSHIVNWIWIFYKYLREF